MQGNGHARVSLHEKIADLAHWDEIECELAVRGVAREYDISVRELRKAIARQRTRNDRRARSNGGDAAPDPNKILEEAAKPELVVETARLPAAAAAVRDLFAGAGVYYEWGTPAKVVSSSDGSLPQIVPLSVDGVVNEVDALCRPIKLTPDGKRIECTLPDRVARQYLAKKHEWQLPRLAGTTTAPLLGEDGGIRAAEGFDRETRLFCANVPVLEVPARPTERQAGAALGTLRAAFQTFPFADSERVWDGKLKLELVDLDKAPGLDESSFLVSLITAVCRPCLYLAPGLMVVAPQRSGSGSGKGLLARAICLIAFGLRLAGFTPGKDKGELEKRINGELLEGGPALFVDNVNDAVLASPTLEGAMTERPFKVRPFGTLKMPMLDSGPFIVVTGNGLTPSDDLVRRFAMFVRLDAKMENPSLRRFPRPDQDFLADIERRRSELLSAVLTIWRFGRQNGERLDVGRPPGSYSAWARWCRDPLFTLGCRDPVERFGELAAADPRRQDELAIFTAWWELHGSELVLAEDLHPQVKRLIDPDSAGPRVHSIRRWLGRRHGMRLAGFEFWVERDPKNKKNPATYRLINRDPEDR
jgi:putative DNA primase/helicase